MEVDKDFRGGGVENHFGPLEKRTSPSGLLRRLRLWVPVCCFGGEHGQELRRKEAVFYSATKSSPTLID
jgi:hypothetical protein